MCATTIMDITIMATRTAMITGILTATIMHTSTRMIMTIITIMRIITSMAPAADAATTTVTSTITDRA